MSTSSLGAVRAVVVCVLFTVSLRLVLCARAVYVLSGAVDAVVSEGSSTPHGLRWDGLYSEERPVVPGSLISHWHIATARVHDSSLRELCCSGARTKSERLDAYWVEGRLILPCGDGVEVALPAMF